MLSTGRAPPERSRASWPKVHPQQLMMLVAHGLMFSYVLVSKSLSAATTLTTSGGKLLEIPRKMKHVIVFLHVIVVSSCFMFLQSSQSSSKDLRLARRLGSCPIVDYWHCACTVYMSQKKTMPKHRSTLHCYMTVPWQFIWVQVLTSISAFDRARASRSRAPASAFNSYSMQFSTIHETSRNITKAPSKPV